MTEEYPPKPPFPPLVSNDQRAEIFGRFRYAPAPTRDSPEAIHILDGWEEKNIVRVSIPQMASRGLGAGMPFHHLGAEQLKGMWAAWEHAGLLPLVLEFDGSFASRFVRGSRSSLSNHAWGCAFDINYSGNELGREPAPIGVRGSVRKLVPIANAWGFFWGGHYSGRKDGMHFELTRVGQRGDAEALPPPPALLSVLRKGSEGDDVRHLQGIVGVPVDGEFGPNTESAVVEFQLGNNLDADGVVGDKTWAELDKDINRPRPGYCPNVMASVFGGTADVERSAYDSHLIGGGELALALPWRFAGERPLVRLWNRKTSKNAVARPEDVGPWNGISAGRSDPYLVAGQRPQAETGRDLSGRRTNLAGVDLSPALARALGVTGLGRVDVEILKEEVA